MLHVRVGAIATFSLWGNDIEVIDQVMKSFLWLTKHLCSTLVGMCIVV